MAQYVYTMMGVGKIVPPKREILKNISLSFFPGAKIGVLGLNGSGKSSLLRIMAGEDTEIEGEATPMPGIRIGYLPQEPNLNPEHTVREAVEEGVARDRLPVDLERARREERGAADDAAQVEDRRACAHARPRPRAVRCRTRSSRGVWLRQRHEAYRRWCRRRRRS